MAVEFRGVGGRRLRGVFVDGELVRGEHRDPVSGVWNEWSADVALFVSLLGARWWPA